MRKSFWTAGCWTGVALLLSALGWTLYVALPSEPRWVLRGRFGSLGLGPDGRTLRTSGQSPREEDRSWYAQGPVQVWDLASGTELHRGLDGPVPQEAWISADGRYAAGLTLPGGAPRQQQLTCVELATGRTNRRVLAAHDHGWGVAFSPGGTLILLSESGSEPPNRFHIQLLETQSLRVLADHEADWRHWAGESEALLAWSLTMDRPRATLWRASANFVAAQAFDSAGVWMAMTPDAKTLFTHENPADSHDLHLLAWKIGPYPLPDSLRQIPERMPAFEDHITLADGKTIVFTHVPPRGETVALVWDLDTNQSLAQYPLDAPDDWFYAAGHKDNRFSILLCHEQSYRLEMYQARPPAKLWTRSWAKLDGAQCAFVPDTEFIMVLANDAGALSAVELLDAATGQTHLVVPIDAQRSPHWTSAGRLLVLNYAPAREPGPAARALAWLRATLALAPQDVSITTTRVIDMGSGDELIRLNLPVHTVPIISADGKFLVAFHDEGDTDGHVECYDLPGRQPWRYILGVPLTTAAMLLLARAAWRRRRQHS